MYKKNNDKFLREVPVDWASGLMSTHPVVFITTVGRVKGKVVPGVAVIATCVDTSYQPPYVSFSTAVYQHLTGETKTDKRGHTNTYLNLCQNRLFVVNLPGIELVEKMDILAQPYPRKEYRDKIKVAGLTAIEPFCLGQHHSLYPSLIKECLAHLECEVVDIHRPKGGDHYTVTGKVVSCSYVSSLGPSSDEIRLNLAERTFHHFGRNQEGNERFVLTGKSLYVKTNLRFHLEKTR